MNYRFLIELAIILFFTKVFGLLMKKLGMPQVVGALLAGLLIGPAVWGPMTGGKFIPVGESVALDVLAELGVILIMFSAGLETDLKELKQNGLKASLIAGFGVLVPLGLGCLIAMPFFGTGNSHAILSCVFVGVIITATSVSITVETLKELGRLKGKVGTTILSAAIIDDVIGIIVLTFVISLKNPGEGDPWWKVVLMTLAFFAAAVLLGVGLNYLFKWLSKKYPHRRRLPIFSLVICMVYAYCAEAVFGIADITGAYVAGIVLSNIKETDYIDRKVAVSSYMFFSPIFFASIGIKVSFSGFSLDVLWFALLFVLAGIAGKIVGCGGAARLCKFSNKDSLRVGIGMIARGEVALIVTQKGIAGGLLESKYMAAVILLVVVSSLLAPVFLKLLYRKEPTPPDFGDAEQDEMRRIAARNLLAGMRDKPAVADGDVAPGVGGHLVSSEVHLPNEADDDPPDDTDDTKTAD